MTSPGMPAIRRELPLTPELFQSWEAILNAAHQFELSADARFGSVLAFDRRGMAVQPVGTKLRLVMGTVRGWTLDGRPVAVVPTEPVSAEVSAGVEYDVRIRLDPPGAAARRHQLVVVPVARASAKQPLAAQAGELRLGRVRIDPVVGPVVAAWPPVVRFAAARPFDAAWREWTAALTAALAGLQGLARRARGKNARALRIAVHDVLRDWRDLPIQVLVRHLRWVVRLGREAPARLVCPASEDDGPLELPDDPTGWPAAVAAVLHGAVPTSRLPRRRLIADEPDPTSPLRLPAEVAIARRGKRLVITLLADLSRARGLELRLPGEADPPASLTFEFGRGLQGESRAEPRPGSVAYPLPAPPAGCPRVTVWPVPAGQPELWLLATPEPISKPRKTRSRTPAGAPNP